MDISAVVAAGAPDSHRSVASSRPDQVAHDFNALLMEMFVRESGLLSAFGADESPEAATVGDLMTQVLASQLGEQLHLVTATQLFGGNR